MSGLREFRDDANVAKSGPPSLRDDDPYRSPTAGSLLSAEASTEKARASVLRISPTLAILIGQTPLYGVFTAVVLFGVAGLSTESPAFLFQAATSELLLFNGRTLFCGPGGRPVASRRRFFASSSRSF